MRKHQKTLSSNSKLSRFARNLLEEWVQLELPTREQPIVVAVSGGADSSALLLALHELNQSGKLNLKLIVAHLDHGLREDSSKDARWVATRAKELGYELASSKAKLRTNSTTTRKENLEQAARKARYEFLDKTARGGGAEIVLTAHTLDDQAETVLMRLLRGSAAEGLSGTRPIRSLKPGTPIKLVRPLLSWARRSDTENFCRSQQVDFRLDEMNDDEGFSRVRVRKQLLPLMKTFNSRVVEALSRTASLLNEDASALADEASRWLESASNKSPKNSETKAPSLSVSVLSEAPPALRRRALRKWILQERGDLNRLERVHLLAVDGLLIGERGGRVVELPGGMTVSRKRGMLELSGKKRLKKAPATSKIQRGSRRR